VKRTKVKIHVPGASSSLDESVIMLSAGLAKKWRIPLNQTVQLRFGSARQEVRTLPTSQPGTIRISQSLASRLGLVHGRQLCCQYKSGSRTIVLGPLIGVLVSRVYAGSADKPFGASTAFCREMSDACGVYGASVFFCTPNEVQGHGDTVPGWHYAGGRWTKGTFPIPDVLYNRLTSRKYENLKNVQQFISHAKSSHNTQMFNEKYLNKNEVFDALRKEAHLNAYLPESHLLHNYQQLKAMCGKYQTVFLKPITGSLGKGIIRIRKQPGGSFVCHLTQLNGIRKQSFASLSRLFSVISGKVKAQRYQIQQGLELITVGGRPVDFRALVQRGETGQWAITSIVARIASNRHFVSNLARGGTLSTVKEALARSETKVSGGLTKLRKASLQIAKGIEAQVPGHFAELGVDLAIDTNGRVWLLEVNSKPSKDDNSPLSPDRKIRPSVKTIVQYARYLSKF